MRYTKIIAVSGTILAVTLGLVSPAEATKQTVRDDHKKDTKASLDITGVKYKITNKRATVSIHVRDLQRKGKFHFMVSSTDAMHAFDAVVQGRRNRSPKVTFAHVRNREDVTVKRCPAKASWKRKQDTLKVSYPDRCFKRLGKVIMVNAASEGQRTKDNIPPIWIRR